MSARNAIERFYRLPQRLLGRIKDRLSESLFGVPIERQSRHAEQRKPVHADERTIRRAGEAELGGMSSEESRMAYERGENPGGLHRGGHGPTSPRNPHA